MKIDVNVLGKKNAVSTTGSKKMRLSEHAESMVFQLFTKNVYSNPIGTVVREITSNCFDSHIEAGVNHPVLIKKSFDEQTKSIYISFIDYGVGMSPDRVENIYGVYFESTKRDSNNEIGGYGIGAKSVLAYKRYSGEGEGEYDNSFFVITIYNGIKYYYNIFEGQKSPEFSLIHQEETEERNGTEIRIPVLEKDLYKFETELGRQLYYFENIIFQGFSDRVVNEYTIVRGKNFLHRGNSLDSNMHVCLGRVYYPIDYNVLGISSYDYALPVAIDVPIGKINVTVSREQLDYSEATISYLKKRLEEAKSELINMLSTQYDNVVTLEDYFEMKENFGILQLEGGKQLDMKNLVSKKDVTYSNFRYKDIKVPESGVLYDIFFKTHRYGNKIKTSYRGRQNDHADVLSESYDGVIKCKNVYYSNTREISRKRLTQAYLKEINLGRFYVVTKTDLTDMMVKIERMFNVHFDNHDKFVNGKLFKTLVKMQKEFFGIVQKHCDEYEKIEVPENFIINYKESLKLSKETLKKTIPVKLHGTWSKKRIKLNDLVNFKGMIFYGDTMEERECDRAYDMFTDLFNRKHVADSYYSSYGFNHDGEHKSIMFINIAKSNLKYVKYFKNAIHISQFHNKIGRRKVDAFIEKYRSVEIINRFDNLSGFYKSDFFLNFSEKWGKKVLQVIEHIDSVNTSAGNNLLNQKYYFSRYLDLSEINKGSKEEKISKILDELEEIEEINSDVLSYIRTPSSYPIVSEEKDNTVLKRMLNDLLTL